jgi:hypothetical protein
MLNTDPDAVGIEDLLHDIYAVYVDTVVKNPFLSTEDEVNSELFHGRLDVSSYKLLVSQFKIT